VRNAQRMLLSWAPPEEAYIVHEFARWNAALTTAACAYLRREDAYWQHAEDLLQPGELLWLTRCDNPPVKVTMVMSGLLKRWVAWAGVAGSEGLSTGSGCAVTGQGATVPAALPDCTVHCPSSLRLSHSLAACKLLLCFAFVLLIAACPSPPHLSCRRTSLAVWERTEIERQISDFDIALGALERISRQAIPKAYTR
jgi:hypothetical protein